MSFTNLTTGNNSSGVNSVNTASITPGANDLILLSVTSRTNITAAPNQPTVTGCGLTWVAIASIDYDTSGSTRKKQTLFRAMGASPSTGALTIDFGGQTQTDINWVVDQVTNVDTTGTNGSGAVVQSATNKDESVTSPTLSVTLSAFSSVGNSTYATFAADNTSGLSSPGSGFSTLGNVASTNLQLMSESKGSNDTAPSATFNSNAMLGGIAIEIKTANTTTTKTITGVSNIIKDIVPQYDHVITIILENTDYANVIGNTTDAPYINNTLLPLGSLLTNYKHIMNESLTDYLALTSGSNQGITTDVNIGPPDNHATITATNIVDRLEAASVSWKAYVEDMPSNWYTSSSRTMGNTGSTDNDGNLTYQEHHNPFIYYTSNNNSYTNARLTKIVPYTQFATDLAVSGGSGLPKYVWITPRMDHDMHDSTSGANRIKSADNWLATEVASILSSDAFTQQSSLLVIVWDEDEGDASGHIPCILIGANVKKNYTSSINYNHYSLLRTIETALGHMSPMQTSGTVDNDKTATIFTDIFTTNTTTTKTQTGKTRITATTSQTITGRAKIVAPAGSIPAGKKVVQGIKYFSIDVMKQTKDTVANQPTTSDIQNLLSTISSKLRPTHIAVSMPFDSTADFTANGNTPAPRNCEDNMKLWFDAIHSSGCKVMYRGTFCNFENIYNFPYAPEGSAYFLPQGTAASAPTDGTSTWLGKVYQRILQIGRNFRPGDIFAPFPEQTGTVFDGNTFLSSGGAGIQTNYANFFNDLIAVANAAFTKIGVTDVVLGMTSNNYSEVRSGWLPSSVFSTSGVVSIDYYGNYGGDGYDPYQYYLDLQTVYTSKGKPVFWQEWGDLMTASEGIADRLSYFDSVMAQVAQMVADGILIGFNYWGGWTGQNTSILSQDDAGNYSLNGQGEILARYFNPIPQATTTRANGIGKSSRSKYTWQIFINGKLFADITGLAQDRHFIQTRGAPDQIDFSVNLDELEKYARALRVNSQDIFQTGISEIRVSRYGVVLTAGKLVTRENDLADERKVIVTFRGWYDLLNFRLSTITYTNQSALQIIKDQINTTQAKSFGNFNFIFGALPSVDATNVYATKQYTNKSIYDIFQELSQDDNGFDFEFTWDKKINIWYPKMGIIRQDIVFSYPGNVHDIRVSDDVTKIVNSLLVRGSGSGPAQKTKTVTDATSQEKYGLREGVVDYPDITDEAQLVNLGNSELALYSSPVVIHDVIMDGSQDPQVGSFHIGDSVRLSVTKLLNLYSGVNAFFRIDRIDVKIDEDEKETVEVSAN